MGLNRDQEDKKPHAGWGQDAPGEFSSKASSKPSHHASSLNMSRSSHLRNSVQFSQLPGGNSYSGSSHVGKNLGSSGVSESQADEGFKGNVYFMKFEHFLKEFNALYMLKIYHRPEEETHSGADDHLMKHTFRRKAKSWKCYVFESFWKGKRLGGPKVDLEKMYVSNLKSRFKKGKSDERTAPSTTSTPTTRGPRSLSRSS